MHQQIKAVRRQVGMTQKIFGESLGVSRDTLASYESGRVIPSNTLVQLLCAIYNVNESWLRTGSGEMFNQTDDTILSAVAEKYHLDNIERSIVETFLTMEPQAREAAKAFLLKMAEAAVRGKEGE